MTTPRLKDRDHSLERAVKHAVELLRDASIVEDALCPGRRPGAYLLQLIALEILLKIGALSQGHNIKKKHDIEGLFELQSEDLRQRVKASFEGEGLVNLHPSRAGLYEQLGTLGHNFVAFRYVYEKWFGFSREERLRQEEAFQRGTFAPEDWDVIFCWQLLTVLLRESLHELRQWRPEEVAPLPWEIEDRGVSG